MHDVDNTQCPAHLAVLALPVPWKLPCMLEAALEAGMKGQNLGFQCALATCTWMVTIHENAKP